MHEFKKKSFHAGLKNLHVEVGPMGRILGENSLVTRALGSQFALPSSPFARSR
jgi:hypothetical protein